MLAKNFLPSLLLLSICAGCNSPDATPPLEEEPQKPASITQETKRPAPHEPLAQEVPKKVDPPKVALGNQLNDETSNSDLSKEPKEEKVSAKLLDKRKLAGEVKNKAILGQIGAVSTGGSASGLANQLSGGSKGVARGAGGLGLRGVGRGGGGKMAYGEMGRLGTAYRGGRSRLSGSTINRAFETSGSHYRTTADDHSRVDNNVAPSLPFTNSLTLTSEDPLSTFAADVDTGAYTLARRTIRNGYKPQPQDVRVEEFMNHFQYDYPSPTEGAFGVHLEAAPSPFDAKGKRKILRVGIQGKKLFKEDRKPVHLTFLVDTSGSMKGPSRLDLAKRSLELVTQKMRSQDTVALVTYASQSKVVLQPTSGANKGQILRAIHTLRASGSTAMSNGLKSAYKLAKRVAKKDHVNRVLVFSDGDANVGTRSHTKLLSEIRSYVKQGITMSTIGFGMGNYKADRMEQLANKGNGNYYYIDQFSQAKKVFHEQLEGTLHVIAKDVKIQVEFNPKAVTAYRLIGYENRAIADHQFRNDKVDAGEIGAGHTVTALYEVVLAQDAPSLATLADVRIRHKEPTGTTAKEQLTTLKVNQQKARLADASHDFQFVVAVAGFAQKLRRTPETESLSFDLLVELAQAATGPGEADRKEFVSLVQKVKKMRNM